MMKPTGTDEKPAQELTATSDAATVQHKKSDCSSDCVHSRQLLCTNMMLDPELGSGLMPS